MRRSAISAGRSGSRNCLESVETELICSHGGLRLCRLAGNNKGSLDPNLRFT